MSLAEGFRGNPSTPLALRDAPTAGEHPPQGVPEDEPVFVLRAQDKVAPYAVNTWTQMAHLSGASTKKQGGAHTVSAEMINWQRGNLDKVKVPD